MKIIQGIVSFIVHLLLLLIAVDATWMIFKGLDYHPLGAILLNSLPEGITPVTRGQFIYYWFGAVALILISLIAHYSGWKSGRHKGIRVKTVEGETMLLNPASLNSFVKVQVENHPSVVAHNLRVKQSGSKGLSVSGSVTVQPTRSLPEIEYELVTLIRQGFERVMGIKKINDVTLVLSVTKKDMQRMTAAGKPPQGPRKAIEAPVKSPLPEAAAALTPAAAAAGLTGETPATPDTPPDTPAEPAAGDSGDQPTDGETRSPQESAKPYRFLFDSAPDSGTQTGGDEAQPDGESDSDEDLQEEAGSDPGSESEEKDKF
jgi:hypothetical protein